MKPVRIWLLLLLALLLPFRGAVAAAMLCPMGAPGHPAEVSLRAAPLAHVHAGHMAVNGPAAEAQPPTPAHEGGHEHTAGGTCHMCSAFCSITPLLSEPPQLLEPSLASAARFPELATPAPRHHSDGQDRPPRST